MRHRRRSSVLGGEPPVGRALLRLALVSFGALIAPLPMAGCEQGEDPPVSQDEPQAVRTEEGMGVDAALLVIFKPLPTVVDSLDNTATPEKATLGRQLYFDERLSQSGQVSCNTCHPLEDWGTDGRKLAEGHGWQTPTRNVPTIYNAAGHFAQFWDGRARTVEQAIEEHAVEDAPYAVPNEAALTSRLEGIPAYRDAMASIFPGEEVGLATYAKAVGAFVRTLMTPAPWDEYLKWQPDALSEEEKRGFLTFMRVGCQNCHIGIYLGGNSFQPLGAEKPWPGPPPGARADQGRFGVTEFTQDRNVFKVPSLRNVEKTAPYFHDGSVATLPEAVKKMAYYQLGEDLSEEEVTSIVTFLQTLTGGPVPSEEGKPELPPAAADPANQ